MTCATRADPATITEFAAPVEEDGPEVQTFRPLLAKTQLETKPLMLVYSADKCGWDPDAFHRCVDSMGAAVCVDHHPLSPLVASDLHTVCRHPLRIFGSFLLCMLGNIPLEHRGHRSSSFAVKHKHALSCMPIVSRMSDNLKGRFMV